MKKLLISLLLGVTLVGGLVGCGNKTVIEGKENNKTVVEDKEVNSPIPEEETMPKEDKINILIDGILELETGVDDQMNSMSDEYRILSSTKVDYDNLNDTIIIEHFYSYIDFSDSEMVGYLVSNPGSADSFVDMSNDDFETIKEIFGKGIPKETKIKIVHKIGEYKILEYTEGTITYRIDK